jgi:hypothetical protein
MDRFVKPHTKIVSQENDHLVKCTVCGAFAYKNSVQKDWWKLLPGRDSTDHFDDDCEQTQEYIKVLEATKWLEKQ